MKNAQRIIIFAMIFIFVISCTVTSVQKDDDIVPTNGKPAMTPTKVFIPEATIAPVESTATPEKKPVTELNQNGPYILFSAVSGIWISNPDGSVMTKLTDLSAEMADLHAIVSPAGDRIVFVSQDQDGLNLVEVLIPSGETRILTRLLDVTQDELVSDPTGKKALAYYAIFNYPSVAWNPGNASLLAFTGAIDGDTSDLYLYDISTDEIFRLTDGKSQAIFPNWSPDGRFVIHYGVSWVPPFGGAIVGYNRLDGIWAVDVTTKKVIQQPKPQGKDLINLGWKDPQNYYSYDSVDICGSQNLRLVNAETGKSEKVMQESFYVIAAHPDTGQLLYSASADCKNTPGQGIFLFSPEDGSIKQLAEEKAYEISWLPESRVFFAYPVGLFDDNGTRFEPPVKENSFHPAISTKGYQAWEVIENRQGRVVISTDGHEWMTQQVGLMDSLLWDPVNGDTLFIALNNGTIYTAIYPEFIPKITGNIPGRIRQMIWLP